MNDLLKCMSARRSVRAYADRDIADADLDAILKAGRLGPSGKGIYPYDFIVIRDPETIQKLVGCRKGGAKMLTTAKAAIAVLGDENRSDTWIEDDAVAMTQMHLMASYLGLGSCWLQIRLRPSDVEGKSAEDYAREVLGFPVNNRLEAILALGPIDEAPEGHDPEALNDDVIHTEKW